MDDARSHNLVLFAEFREHLNSSPGPQQHRNHNLGLGLDSAGLGGGRRGGVGADRPGRGATSAAAMPRRRPGPAALGAALGLAVAAGLARAQSASPAASSPPLPPAASLAPSAASAASPASPASPSEGARAPAMEPDDYDDYAFPSPAGRAVLRTELAYAAGAPQYTGPIPQCGVSGSRRASRPRAAPGD